jgi:hypothetical protein
MRLTKCTFLFVFALSGCHLIFPFETEERATADSGVADLADGSTQDDGTTDRALAEATSMDVPVADASLADAPSFDAILPDGPLPDAPLLPDGLPPDAPLPDSPLPDTLPPSDGPPPDSPLPTGTVVVTEIMVSPFKYASDGEWFELHNPPGRAPVNLKGWKLLDKESQKTPHEIKTNLILNGGQHIVLGAFGATIPVIYFYRSTAYCGNQICFPDASPDFIEIRDPNDKVVDKVAYDFKGTSNWPIVTGASMSLKAGATDNSTWSSWCAETQVISGDPEKNKGSPGAAAKCN